MKKFSILMFGLVFFGWFLFNLNEWLPYLFSNLIGSLDRLLEQNGLLDYREVVFFALLAFILTFIKFYFRLVLLIIFSPLIIARIGYFYAMGISRPGKRDSLPNEIKSESELFEQSKIENKDPEASKREAKDSLTTAQRKEDPIKPKTSWWSGKLDKNAPAVVRRTN